MPQFNTNIVLHGVSLTVRGQYQPAERADRDYPGYGPYVTEVTGIWAGAVEVTPLIDALADPSDLDELILQTL